MPTPCARDYDYTLEFLGKDAVRSHLKTDRYFQALRDPNAFHMHPLNYLRAVAAEIERLGGQIFEGSAVTRCALDGAEKQAHTANGLVKARRVVFTPAATRLPRRQAQARLPADRYLCDADRAAPEMIRTAIATRDAIGDNRRAGRLLPTRGNGERILWGGRITTRAASPAALARELRREMTTPIRS